jgi:hypothetical protein
LWERARKKAGLGGRRFLYERFYFVFIINATMTPTAATMAPVTQGEPWLAQVAMPRGASARTWK